MLDFFSKFKKYQKYFRLLSLRLFVLILLLVFVFDYNRGEDLVYAFSNTLTVIPEKYLILDKNNSWQALENSFYLDLNQDSKNTDFNKENSAYLFVGGAGDSGGGSSFLNGDNNEDESDLGGNDSSGYDDNGSVLGISEDNEESAQEDKNNSEDDIDVDNNNLEQNLDNQNNSNGAKNDIGDNNLNNLNIEGGEGRDEANFGENEGEVNQGEDDEQSGDGENNGEGNFKSNEEGADGFVEGGQGSEGASNDASLEEQNNSEPEEKADFNNSDDNSSEESDGQDEAGDGSVDLTDEASDERIENNNSETDEQGFNKEDSQPSEDADTSGDLGFLSNFKSFLSDIFSFNLVYADNDSTSSALISTSTEANFLSKNSQGYEVRKSVIYEGFSVVRDEQSIGDSVEVDLKLSMFGKSNIAGSVLLFEYRVNNDWEKLEQFDLNKSISNQSVGDYISLKLPQKVLWDDLGKIQIRVSYLSKIKTQREKTQIFIDALWLELRYENNVEESEKEEKEEILAQKKQEEKKYDLINLGDKDNFRFKDEPSFRFQYKRKKGLLGKIGSAILDLFIDEYKDLKISAKVILPNGELGEGLATVEYLEDGEFKIDFKKPHRNFRPGSYKIQIIINDDGKIYKETQDFSWGVLAFNVDKSIYKKGDKAYLQMAVLDDGGHTLCSADLEMEIKSPNGHLSYLSTSDGSIEKNPLCIDGKDTVIDTPDYFAYFSVNDLGTYQIKLKAHIKNGDKEITDYFQVIPESKQDFELQRIGPTRIYPKANYKMSFHIKAKKDFIGQFKEYVPIDFKIVSGEGIFEAKQGDTKELMWNVNWQAGKEYDFYYIFDAPDISPEFYLLGRAKMTSENEEKVFEEAREWQIASDALPLDVQFSKSRTDNPYSDTEETLASLSGLNGNETYIFFGGIGSNRWDGGAVRTEISLGTSTPEDENTHFPHLVENLEGPNADDGASLFMMGKQDWTSGDTLYYRADKITGTADLDADEVFLMAMATSTMGTFGKDYFYAEDTTATDVTTSYADFASITFTPDGTSEYLIIASMEANVDASGNWAEMGIYNGSAMMVQHIRDSEDANDTMQLFVATSTISSAVSTTFSVRARAETDTTIDHFSSRILIIRLDYYANHSCKSIKDSGAMGTTPSVRASTSLALDNAGDVVALYFGGFSSTDQASDVSARARYDSTVEYQITDADNANGEGRVNVWLANNDIHTTLWLDNISVPDTNSHTYDFSYERGGTVGANYEYAMVCVWSEEPAFVPLSVTAEEQYKNDGSTIIANGGWTNDGVSLQALASNLESGNNSIDYYFEVIQDSDSFSTGTSTLSSNACTNGTSWSACSSHIWGASVSFDWYNDDWLYRKKITLNASQIEGNLNGFPILATTTDSDFAYTAFGGHMGSSTGADIVITDSTGTTTLPYEREYYSSTTGEIVLWIKADLSSTQNTDLYIYYGNSGVSQDYATTTGVWDDNYKAVWHLSESGSGTRYDSTKYANNGTPTSFEGDEGVSAKIDGGDEYDGGDRVTVADSDSLRPSSFTLEAWVKTADNGTWQGVFTKLNSSGYVGYNLNMDRDTHTLRMMTGDSSSFSYTQSNIGYNDNAWHHLVGLYDGTTASLYVDGVKQNDEDVQPVEHVTDSLYIGAYYTNSTGILWDNQIDEIRISSSTRSDAWIKTEYNNQSDVSSFLSFGDELAKNNVGRVVGQIQSLPDDDYKWQVVACQGNTCSDWDDFNATTPNFSVDTTNPLAPGPLTLSSKTSTSLTIKYGYQATESNFLKYRVFYKKGNSGVSESDNEYTNSDLDYIDYGGSSEFTISNLDINTNYVFNIWVYDKAGNKASSTELSVSTAEAGRAKTVMFVGGTYSGDGTSGQNSDTNQTFASFDFSLPEDDVHISDAYIIFEAQFEAYANNAANYSGYDIAFDACQKPCTVDAFSSSNRVLDSDSSVLAYNETESNQVRILVDVSDEGELSSYTGGGATMSAQIGYNIKRGSATTSIATARAILVLTYTYDKNSESIANTVIYPLESQSSGDSGTRQSVQSDDCTLNSNCPLFAYNMTIPEFSSSDGAQKLSQWFRFFGINDLNNANDIVVNANIEGTDVNSDDYVHEAFNAGTQGNFPQIIFTDISGFSENSNQEIELHPYCPNGGANYYALGGEVFETYTASSSAGTKTRTVSFPLGVVSNGLTTATTSRSISVYFPENGEGTGEVDIKKAWFRVVSNNYNTGANTMTISTKVGNNATSSDYVYDYDVGGAVVKPAFTIIHVIPSSDYSELEEANALNPKQVQINTTNSNSGQGGTSAELLITYTYDTEKSGYLSALKLFAGQIHQNSNTQSATTSVSLAVLPEEDSNKTILAGALLANYLITDSDGAMPSANLTLDANLSTSTSPTCTNAYNAHPDGINSFAEFYKDVSAQLSVNNNQQYYACYSNDGGGDTSAGAKMAGQLIYVYQYYNPSSINVWADKQKKSDNFTTITNGSWTDEDEVYLSAYSTDTASSSRIDFYFEALANANSFTTSNDIPSSYCADGTAWGSCSAKIWKDSASTTTWYDSDWLYRKRITLNASQIVANLNDFPILATTTDSNFAYTAFGGHMGSSTGADIVITDSDGATALPYEREYYSSSTGEIVLWIKADISSSTNKTLYIYYGNPSVASDQSNPEAVWDNNFGAVYHLSESGSGTRYDSTANNNDGTPLNFEGDEGVSAKIDGGDDYDAGDRVEVADSESLRPSTFTIEAWVKTYSNGTWQGAFTKLKSGDYQGYNLNLQRSSNYLAMMIGDSSSYSYVYSDNGYNDNAWHHLVGLYDGTKGYLYVDGVKQSDEKTQNVEHVTDSLYLGAYYTNSTGILWDNQIDEIRISSSTRSAGWIKTEYNNQKNVADFLSFSANEDTYSLQSYSVDVNITSIPDSASGYKWQVLACNDLGDCSAWDAFDVTPNFKVDTVDPVAPGDLTLATTTATTITLNFGSAGSDDNFAYYKIFYKIGISNVEDTDSQHIDSNLNYVDYNGATTTTITNLEADTQYVINIWIYDYAGNKASANEIVVNTASAPHQRANTIILPAGTYSGDGSTGQNSDTDNTFSSFSFSLPETDIDIKNAYIVFEAQFEAYADNSGDYSGYKLAFDACEGSSCSPDAFSGTGRVVNSDSNILAYDESESNVVRLLLDVSDEDVLSDYSGDGETVRAQVGYNIQRGTAINSISWAKALLYLTYSFNGDDSQSYTNTIVYPLDSNDSGDSGSRQSSVSGACTKNSDCPTFSYNVYVPEFGKRLFQWFDISEINDLNNATDISLNVNVEGSDVDSDTYIHECANAGTQGNIQNKIFDSVYGFSENSGQDLEIYNSGGTNYILGGEVFETYFASSSASIKTRTVAFPLGIISDGQSLDTASASVDVYFPENGGGSGIIDIQKAWFRIKSNDYNSGAYTLTVSSKVGDNAQSSNLIYNLDVGGTIVDPVFNVYHIIDNSNYSELEEANASVPKEVTLYVAADSTYLGGVSAELMITYTYSSEANGYLSSLSLFGMQSDDDGNATEASSTGLKIVLPELRGTKTMRGGSLLASYLMSDSDNVMPGGWFTLGSDISTSSPTCSNSYYHRPDAVNSFAEFYNNVSSRLGSVNNEEYKICVSNSPSDVSAGAKMNAILNYVYQWDAVKPKFTQDDWRWYENADSAQPVSAKASENTAISNVNLADILRLRINVGVVRENLEVHSQSFKLQYGLGSNCSSISDWADVGSAGGSEAWIGYNNPAPIDGDALSSLLLASSTVLETYEESNPTVSNVNSIAVGEYGEWDFVLYNNSATSSSDYCFRMVKSDGSVLDDYLSDSYPRLTTAASNTAPSNAYSLGQYKDDETAIANLEWINEDSVKLKAAATDPNINETITLYFELKTATESFTTATTEPSGACTYGTAYNSCSSKIWYVAPASNGDYRSNPYIGTTSITAIPELSAGYKWQVLACDDSGACSAWQQFDISPNFRIDMTAPTPPGSLSFASSTATSLQFNFGASTTEDNFNRYRIFYKEGTSGVSESDTEHSDGNLNFIDYNGATSTLVENLSAGTVYVFNIWAYDLAGNSASSTQETVATTSSSYTAPTGELNSSTQKTDGSGAVDIVIKVDDADNDNTLRAKIEYEAGTACSFSSPLDPTLDETDENITANYGDPDIDNNYPYQVGTSSAYIWTSPGENYVSFDWLSKTDLPNANGTYCIRLTVNDGMFDQDTPDTQLVLLDNVAPSAPGALSLESKDYDSVVLDFGSASSDTHFSKYRIFYKKGIAGVSESDSEHIDSNLNYANYNGAGSTTVLSLEPNTNYVFNIWAYDDYGNKASSTELTVKTNAVPANASADSQKKYSDLSVINNGDWVNENDILFYASAHDKDQGDLLTFYYEIIDNSSSFTTDTSLPSSTCSSGSSWSACSGHIWEVSTSTPTLPSDWFNKDWLYRKKITISSDQVLSAENGFPVLATTTDSDLSSYARGDAYDIVFTDSSGTSTLAFEREYYASSTGELAVWLKVNLSSTTDTVVYMYYGNAQNETDYSTTTGVWGSDALGVWHLAESVVDESSESLAIQDSTANNNNGDQYGTNEMNAWVYKGQEFDGIDDYIDFGNVGSFRTISFWIKANSTTEDVMDFQAGTNSITISNGVLSANGFTSPTIYIDGIATTSIDTAWHFVQITDTSDVGASAFTLGKISSSYFNGLIDELQMYSAQKSAQWLKTQYNNYVSVSKFLSFDSQFKVASYYETVLAVDFDDSSNGYKWQVMVCDDDGDCSDWAQFNATTPNFKVDTTPPTSPGALSMNARTSSSITLAFGSQTTEANFSKYRIFYASSSPISESSVEHIDSNLDYIDYNGASVTTISGLSPNTAYYFNIWAYDLAGNKASSTEVNINTSPAISSPGVFFYTKNERTLYYRVWDGSSWGAEQSGPTLGSASGDNIRQIRAIRSDDGGKIAIVAKTWDGSNQEWWATVYRYVADDFVNTAQLGSAEADATNNQLMTACMASLSGGEFFIVRNNNASDGTLVYSWNVDDGWVAESSGPNPVALMNGCKLIRRPGTDNYLLITYDDDRDVGTAYYYGGSTYANSWTAWTEHSTTEEDADNFVGDAFFDPSDNTHGAINYSNSSTALNTTVKYFICDNTSINYGSEVTSPTTWADDFVSGEFAVNPGSNGVAYYIGSDIDDEVNVFKVDASTTPIVWSEPTNGDNISGTSLYDYTNDSQHPYALKFYRNDYGLALWNDRTNPSTPKYRIVNAGTNSLDSSDTAVPGADSNLWVRVRAYKDPNEKELLVLYQNDDVDYSAVFWDGNNHRFYNTSDNPGSNQVWTELVSASGAFDRDDENTAFAYASYNSEPNTPSALTQLKTDASTTIANLGWTNESTILLRGEYTDADTEEQLRVYLELVDVSSSFTSTTTNACASTTSYTACASKVWLVASSTKDDYSLNPLIVTATITAIPDSSSGYKWQTMVCDDDNACSEWTKFNATTPNFRVDTTAPSAPGNLTISAKDSSSVTLTFGSQSSDSNFSDYRIFYKQGTSGASINDTEHDDPDLDYIDYNGTSNTVVLSLASSTDYVFNIWAFDLAGNYTPATEVSTTTSEGPRISQTSYLFENDSASDVNSNTAVAGADTAISDIKIGERLNVRIQVENNGGDIASNKVYVLQFENQTDNPGVWTDVGASTEISYSLGLSGDNADVIISSKANANSNSWINGAWYEGVNTTANFSIDYGEYTEFVFAIETSNALTNKTYRLRLYNSSDSEALYSYSTYPTLSTVTNDTYRSSQDISTSLPSTNDDGVYYFDPISYSNYSSDDGVYVISSSTNAYPIQYFAIKHTNNTDAITITWNGQSSTSTSVKNIVLQVYTFGSPNQWTTIYTHSTSSANLDFTISKFINSSLSDYYDSDYWTYWRIYQESGDEILRTDYFNVSFSSPIPQAEQIHYRFRNDDEDENSATWREGEDTGDPSGTSDFLNKGENIRLRFEVANLGAGDANNYVYQIQYATSTGSCDSSLSWTNINTSDSNHWQVATSSYISGQETSTAQLSNSEGYSFVSGSMLEYPYATSTQVSLSEEEYTEIEYTIKATSNAISAGTYCFRLTNNGSELYSYEEYPILTLSGNTNTAPYFTVWPSDNGSASTSPTTYNTSVTFTATADDADSPNYYLAICKTNSISAGNDGPPTCTAGDWCISDLTSTSTEATCDYIATSSDEELEWYAFVCDKHPGYSIAQCSSASQGSSTPENESPFVINHPPSFTAVETVVDNQDPGSAFTIRTTSSDTDSVGGQDTLYLYVCKTNSASFSGCAGGSSDTVCSATATSSPNAQCVYQDTAPTPAGQTTYYAFLYDSHGLAATTNSLSSSYTINNVAPVLGSLVLNNGDDITLNMKDMPDTSISTVNTSITDQNGCTDLVSATAVIYMTGVSNGSNCTDDDNNCYQIGTTNCVLSDCSGDSDAVATYTCSDALKYFATPTDSSNGNPWEPYKWTSKLTVYDGSNYVSTTSNEVELNTTQAISVTESVIDFDELYAGEDTGSENATTTLVNAGNCPIDSTVSGTDLNGNPSGTLGVSQIEWDLNNFTYSNGTDLDSVGTNVDINAPKATSTNEVYDQLYWGIGIPLGADASSYTGQNTFSAVIDNDGW